MALAKRCISLHSQLTITGYVIEQQTEKHSSLLLHMRVEWELFVTMQVLWVLFFFSVRAQMFSLRLCFALVGFQGFLSLNVSIIRYLGLHFNTYLSFQPSLCPSWNPCRGWTSSLPFPLVISSWNFPVVPAASRQN